MTAYKKSIQYKARINSLVGNKDPVDILSSTGVGLAQLLKDVAAAQAKAIPVGTWSINDIVQHLVDAEMVNGCRLRIVLSVEQPELPGFNQDYWVQRFNSKQALKTALMEWNVFRNYNLRLIKTLTNEELKRKYLHKERGAETVFDLLKLMAGHDLIHLDQIRKLL